MSRTEGLRALLSSTTFLRLWAIGGCVNAMRWFEVLAAALFTLDMTGSGLAVAVVSAARTLPMLFLGAFAGVMAEAVNRKRVLVAGQLVTSVASATVAILAVLGAAQPWHVALAALIAGIVWSTEMSTRRRMVGECVPPSLVPRALALDTLTNSITRMIGPITAGTLYQFTGLGGAFSLSALLYLLAALLATGLQHEQDIRRFVLSHVPRDLAEAVSFARGHAVIAGVLLVTIAMNLLGFPYSALIAPIGRNHFMVSPALVGMMAAAESFGAFLGGLWLAGGDPPGKGRVLMVGGSLLFLVCAALMPLMPLFWLAWSLLVIGGFGSAAFANMQTSLIITHAPPHMRSRLMGLLTVCIGAGPVGILLVGVLASALGPLGAVSTIELAGLAAVIAAGSLWRRREQRPAGPRGSRGVAAGLQRRTAMPDASAEVQFLSGIRVVDFTQFEAGPSSTEALAWLGAEVVKIENPGVGDPGRRLRKGKPDDDPFYFQQFNANKKSITVNLKSPRGLALVKDLLRKADVCVENMAPGTIERLGLGYDDVKAINPGIIYCQVKGFGTGSPYEKNLAFDMIAQATGGTISVTGEKGRMPVKPGLSLGDTGTGMTMAITILGALFRRAQTGEGHRLQVAMQDAMLHYMRTNFATQARSGRAVERDGAHSGGGSNAPSGLYPCARGGANDYVWIMTSRANPEHWSRLCNVMGREELINDPRFATPADRAKNHEELDAMITAWTKTRTKHEAMDQVGSAGIPAGAVFDTMELTNEPSFEQRGIMQYMRHPSYQPFKMPAWPVRIDGKPPQVKASPILGQHTDEVLTSWLELSDSEVKSLHDEGVV